MEENGGLNAFGKVSSLRVVAGRADRGTYLKELSFTAPFKVMSPFVLPDGSIRVMPLFASSGIMEGDIQKIHMETEPYTKMECISQSWEKLHRMKTGYAKRNTLLKVARESVMVYRPLPVIPFDQSAFEGYTEICLEDATSSMFYQEILSCGRVKKGERFGYRYYNSLSEVRRCKRLIYRENNRFRPALDGMEETGMFEGYSYLATILIFHTNSLSYMEEIRELLDNTSGMCGGATFTADSDMVVRILSNQMQKLQQICDKIYDIFMPFPRSDSILIEEE